MHPVRVLWGKWVVFQIPGAEEDTYVVLNKIALVQIDVGRIVAQQKWGLIWWFIMISTIITISTISFIIILILWW